MENLFIGDNLAQLLVKAKEIKPTHTGNLLHKFAFESCTHRKLWLQKNEDMPNYLNISKDEIGKISYATQKRIQHFSWETEEDIYGNHTQRFKAKVGKTLKKIFLPDVLTANEITPQDIEIFVEQLKALQGKVNSENDFDDMRITKSFGYYNECHTSELAQDGCGSLGESCMRYDECEEQDYFAIYQDHCDMLISENENGLIEARALLWTATCGTKIMDRIYTDESFKEQNFKAWANHHGYVHKLKQSYSNKIDFVKNGEEIDQKTFFIELHDGYLNDYRRFPYMDTFTYSFSHEDTDYLTNNPKGAFEEFGVTKFKKYECTDGDYGYHEVWKAFVFKKEDEGITLREDVVSGDTREHWVHKDYIHPESEMFGVLQKHFKSIDAENIFNDVGVSLHFENNRFKRGEDDYDMLIKVVDKDDRAGHRLLCFESETFYCDASSERYHKSTEHIKTTCGNYTCVKDFTIKDLEGNIIRRRDASIVSIEGKLKIVNSQHHRCVKTFDNVYRLRSECEEILWYGTTRWFSRVVHKKEIAIAEQTNKDIVKLYEKYNTLTLEDVDKGNFDKRVKY